MLREVLSSRLFLVGLLFFVLIVVGGVFYLRPVERETAERLAGTEERMKPLVEAQKAPPEAVVDETSQGGRRHADGTSHGEPHEPPAETPAEPKVTVMHDWASLTDEERLQRAKAANQVLIDEIAGDPRYAELHKLMMENEFPYSPEVEAQLRDANMRIRQEGVEYDTAIAEIDTKMSDPNISPRELGKLMRERYELRNRYKGGQ